MVRNETDPVVISGIGGRYPESRNIEEFWSNLLSGQELCTADDRRWPIGYYSLPPKSGKVPDIEKFDGAFFGMSDKSCNEMDPQIKIAQETTFEAVLDAGFDPVELSGYRTGVFIGYCYSDTSSAKVAKGGSYDSDWTEEQSVISKAFGFKGQCMTYDSACASTFSAYNEAVKAVEAGVIDTAIVVGTAVCLLPFTASAFRQLGMTSEDGKCRCMDDGAKGYVRSETISTIVFQRKSVAKRVYAIVLNTATNSDGYKPEGITFPGIDSMVRLMNKAYDEIGLDPKDTKYIEGHVTGTQAGDPVECSAIERVFCPDDRVDPILVGCLKSNMGHAEGGSGAAAITKACLIMQKGIIPPNILYDKPNRNIPGLLNGKLKPVLNVEQFNGDVISLNSFGFGGSNIHTIFRSYDESLNVNIDVITGSNGIKRLILFKSRTRIGFEKLIRKIQFYREEITTEFLDLLNNVSKLDDKWILPVRGYIILDSKKRIIASDCQICSTQNDTNQGISIQTRMDPPPSWVANHIDILRKINLNCEKISITTNVNDVTLKYVDGNNQNIELQIKKTTGFDSLLSFIGKVYMSGCNGIEVNKLYPRINYPVSRSTASVSPLIEWNHDSSWTVHKVPEYFILPVLKAFTFDYSGLQNYFSGHKIDGRILFPAAGYLWTIWQSLAIDIGKWSLIAYLQTGVKFWDVKLTRAIVVKPGEELFITTRMNKDTGAFEINHNQSCIVSGYAALTFDEDCPMQEKSINSELTQKSIETIPAKDFYKELRVRGYDYEDDFKGVTHCNVDGSGGTVSFLRNWTCFIDAVFQLTLINDTSRQLLVPTGFEYLQVDAKVFLPISTEEVNMYKNIEQSYVIERNELEEAKLIEGEESEPKQNIEVKEETQEFKVIIVKETLEIFTNGIYIKGMKAMPAPRKKAVPIVRAQYFLPFNQKIGKENSVEKSEYELKCLNILNGKNDEEMVDQNNNEEVIANEDMALLDSLKKGKSFSEMKSIDTSKDILTKIPFEEETIFHQFNIVSDCFPLKELKIAEINLSTKSNIQEPIEMLFRELTPGTSYVTYNDTNISKAEEEQKKTIDDYFGMKTIESDLIVIQHPSLGFTFTNPVSAHEQRENFTKVLESSFGKMTNESFLMVITRTNPTIVEEKLDPKCSIEMDSVDYILSEIKKSNFVQISVKQVGSYVSILAKKVNQSELNTIEKIIEIDSLNYEWIEKLKEQLYVREPDENGNEIKVKPSGTKSIWIQSINEDITGLSGFYNCIRHEDKRIHGVIIMDKDCNQDNVMNKAFEMNLNLVTYKNGSFGSITHSRQIIPDSEDSKVSITRSIPNEDTIAYCLDVETKGDLSSLRYQQVNVENGPGVVNIYYGALNFKDIMVSSGRVPLTAYPESWRFLNGGNLGMEFSGIDFNGKRVMGLCQADAIATKINLGSGIEWLFDVPDWMTLEEAATIPVVYATAFYALIMRGKMINGESILIHAGSGGVGQAAINIALSMNCEIFTTVGTKEKREFIKNTFRSIKDDHIFDSRSISFADDILIATNGRGVDVILNSLSEEKLQAGLDCLAKNGRFLEIGKYDFMANSPIDPVKLYHNQTFESICLAFFMTKIQSYEGKGIHPDLLTLRTLMIDGLKNRKLKPLSRHVFDRNQTEESFRFMATGKHIGKVLIRMRNEEDEKQDVNIPNSRVRVSFDATKSYIVIGGLGGMGLEICHWLVSKGVRNLIITSRTGIRTSYHRFFVDRLKSLRANVEVVAKDVSELNQAKELIDFAATLGPVGGIFNLAMVLKDAAFEDQTIQSFEDCCRIKVRGTFNLDQITRSVCHSLDHFVCFSSLASSLGNSGQSNYGLANGFMDTLCMKRREDGLPAMSFAWGAIGDVGHVAENMGNDVVVVGSVPQRINSCLDVVERNLYSDQSYIGSLVPVDRSSFEVKGDIVATILNVLGIKNHSKVDPKSTLGDLGLDSLMAVEIKQVLEKKFDKVLSTKEIRETTIEGLKQMQSEHEAKSGIKLDIVLDNKLEFGMELKLLNETFEPLFNTDSKDLDPIFVLPPVEGSFENMNAMMNKLSGMTKRPLIGLNWIQEVDPYENVTDVASYYAEQLEQKYSSIESFDMVAYSFGSYIALEMAYLFQKRGKQKIGKLIILDFSPSFGKPYLTAHRVVDDNTSPNFVNILMSYFSEKIYSGEYNMDDKITEIPDDPKLKKYFDTFKNAMGSKYTDDDYMDSFNRIRKKFKMIRDYDPKETLNHNVKLIRATTVSLTNVELDMAHDYDLSKNLSGVVKVVKLDGDHHSFLKLNPDTVAKEIVNYISHE